MANERLLNANFAASFVDEEFRKAFFKDVLNETKVLEQIVSVIGDVAIFPVSESRPDIVIFADNLRLLILFEAKTWWPNDIQLEKYTNLARNTYKETEIKSFHLVYSESQRKEIEDHIRNSSIKYPVLFLTDFIDSVPNLQQQIMRAELDKI